MFSRRLLFVWFSAGAVLACGQDLTPSKSDRTDLKNEGPCAPVDPTTYSIGAGDILFIKVLRDADFTGQYLVRPDGRITLPMGVGEIHAEGLTPDQVSSQVT